MCLGVDVTPEMQEAEDLILKEFRQAYVGDFAFDHYGSETSFLKGLNEAVEQDDIILLTVRADLFQAFKTFLAGQFSFKQKPQKTVRHLIAETHPELEKDTIKELALLPVKSDVFISQDGLYSGYAIRTDTQILLVLPLDPTRIAYLLGDGVFPYLRDNLDVSAVSQDNLEGVEPVNAEKTTAWNGVPQKKNAARTAKLSAATEAAIAEEKANEAAETIAEAFEKQETSEIPSAAINEELAKAEEAAGEETPADEPAAEEAAETPAADEPNVPSSVDEYDRAYVEGVLQTLREKDIKVAVADTKTVDFLRKMAEDGLVFDDVLTLTDLTLDREDLSGDDYAARLAENAFENTGSKLGASLTKVYSQLNEDGDQEFTIFTSIADGTAANRAKITAEPGETPPDLIYRALEVMFHMIALYSEQDGFAVEEAPAKPAKKGKKARKQKKADKKKA